MLREWVVEGGGLYGYFGEQGLPAGIQECLERFHRRSVDYLSRQFVPMFFFQIIKKMNHLRLSYEDH